MITHERHCIFSHLYNEKSNIDGSSESAWYVDGIHPSYYRFTGVYIFLHVLIISVAPDPTYGQSGFQSVDGRNNSNHITRALICRVTRTDPCRNEQRIINERIGNGTPGCETQDESIFFPINELFAIRRSVSNSHRKI